MRDEQGQIVPAGVFVPVIEQLGLVRMIDRHVLDLASGLPDRQSALCSSPSTSPA